MSLMEDLQRTTKLRVFPRSFAGNELGEIGMVRTETETLAAVSGKLREKFSGRDMGGYLLCPTDHGNRLALNELFPFTKPVAIGRKAASFGLGDRLGYANPAQVRAIAKTELLPVLAQQSLRELTLTGRTNPQVIDVAAWAVFREGFRKGFASDGDHLKSKPEIADALKAGCTMITLDCSLALKSCAAGERELEAGFESLPAAVRKAYEETYLRSRAPEEFGLKFTKGGLYKLSVVYGGALELIRDVYFDLLVPAGRPIDFEISLDETVETTSPEAHYFVAVEMEKMGVEATSVAPKFVGEFQKAIDYIGDLDELRRTMKIHAAMADRFGYKLSLHSGSEKYSVLPVIARATGGRFHVKTAGTSWLEAVETISKHDPALYRKMHRTALQHLDDAKKFYVVHCDASRIPPLDTVSDGDLPHYLDLGNNDSRQLMHITYGFILGDPALKKEIFDFLNSHFDLYESEEEELCDRHLNLLK